MPLKSTRAKTKKGKQRVISANIAEMHKSARFMSVMRSKGKTAANHMAIAAAINAATPKKRKRKSTR